MRFVKYLFICLLLSSQAFCRAKLQGWCEAGNVSVSISGTPGSGSQKFQQSYPSCTVTVYTTGTVNTINIYADNAGTAKANPFTASSDGTWFFYADNQRVDLKFSGGGISSPFTLSDFLLADSGQLTTTLNALAFNATPTFAAAANSIFTMTLTGNVTSSTVTGAVTGQIIGFSICQDGVGGRTFAWPASFLRPPTVNSAASSCTNASFFYDGTNWRQFAATGDSLVASGGTLTGTYAGGPTWSGNHTFSGSNTFSGNNAFTGSNTFSGSNTFGQLNGRIINASACATSPAPSWCSGSDLGAWANAAATQLGSPGEVWISPGTISTAPNLPRGYTLEFMPGTYTLSVDWPMYHRNTHYVGHGAVIQYTRDAGTYALQLGKASAFTAMNCSVTNGSATVTWVSGGGGNFNDIDAGDVLYALNQPGNILSVSGNTITLTAVWPGATNANTPCVAYLTPDAVIDTQFASITFDDFLFQYTGAGTNAADGMFAFKVMSTPVLRNVRVANMPNGTGYNSIGTITGRDFEQSCANVKNCAIFDGATFGGYNFPSNNWTIFGFRADQYSGANGNACNALLIKSNSTGNSIYGFDAEYNQCTETVRIQDTATGNGLYAGCRFEGNGDSTANSRDVRLAGTATNNTINGCYHTSGVTNTPNTGIQADATTVGTTLENEKFNVAAGTPYATCVSAANGSTGRLINVACPTVNSMPTNGTWATEDNGSNYTVNTLTVQSAGASALSVPNGGVNIAGNIVGQSGIKLSGGGGQAPLSGDGTGTQISAYQLATQFVANKGTACTNGELALSAGWQSSGSATVTAVAGTGQTCSWTITTGTTTAANPTITDTLTNALPGATTVCWMNIYGGTHTAVAGESLRQTTLSATAPVFTANFTPTAAGTTYFVTRSCGP